jgi:hypothetical protein
VLRNTGNEVQVIRHDACGYVDLWVPDNKSIRMIPSACKKPGFMGTALKPGEDYKRDLQVYAKLAPGVGESEWVTFRLGFQNAFQSEKDPVQPNPVPQTLWSNPVTVRVKRVPGSSRGAAVNKTNLPADANGTGGVSITALHGVTNGTLLTVPPLGRSTLYLQTLTAERITLSAIEVSVEISSLADSDASNPSKATVTVTNKSDRAIPGPIQVIFDALTPSVTLANATGSSRGGPYITIPNASLLGPGKSVSIDVQLSNPKNETIKFVPMVHSGSFE